MDDSEEEVQLIAEVSKLDSKLKQAGCTCDENLYVHLFTDLNVKPLAKRLGLWRFRRDLCPEQVASLQPREAASGGCGGPAATSVTSQAVIEKKIGLKRKLEKPK
jgi:hypothetical protein